MQDSKNKTILFQCIICHSIDQKLNNLCGNHYYCSECINNAYEHKIQMKEEINNRCPECKRTFNKDLLNKILSENIKSEIVKYDVVKEFDIPSIFDLFKCKNCKPPNQGLVMLNKYDCPQFYKCESEDCGKESCLYCFGLVHGSDSSDLYEKNIHNDNKKSITKSSHRECKTYYEIMLDLENIMQYAVIKSCPKCKSRIINEKDTPRIKDGSCAHIKCLRCHMDYCYICGGHEENLDYNNNLTKQRIFRHNDEWQTNGKRCPMYIRDFSKVVKMWPKDEIQASVKFENYKMLSCMNRLLKKYKFEMVKKAYDVYSNTRLSLLQKHYFEGDAQYKEFEIIPVIEQKVLSQFKLLP